MPETETELEEFIKLLKIAVNRAIALFPSNIPEYTQKRVAFVSGYILSDSQEISDIMESLAK